MVLRHSAVIAAAIAFVTLPTMLVHADWPMFRRDGARSGIAEWQELAGAELAWATELGGSVDSSPAVVGGTVFVGNSLGEMHALSAEDGSPLWRFETVGAVVSSPAVADGMVLFGSVDGFCYAVDAETGREAWRYRTRGAIISSPAIIDSRVLFGSMDGRMYCLSLSDGSPVWRTEPGASIQCSPAVANGLVFFGDDEGAMQAVMLSDGSVAWKHEGRGRVIAAPVVADGTVVFGVMGPSALRPPKLDYLVALRADTGQRLWAQNEAYSILGAPVIAGGHVFFVTVEGYVSKTVARAASLSDGELLWERTLGGVVDSAPALILRSLEFEGDLSDAGLCFGCHDGRLYVLNAETGQVVGVESLAQKVYSSPAVVDGRVYIGANDGRLHCLTLQ